MGVFVDASYSAYHQMVIDALSMVISQMNSTSALYTSSHVAPSPT